MDGRGRLWGGNDRDGRGGDSVHGCAVELRTEIELTEHGVLRTRHELINTAPSPYTLDRLACLMPRSRLHADRLARVLDTLDDQRRQP
jgi:hypothetical protein